MQTPQGVAPAPQFREATWPGSAAMFGANTFEMQALATSELQRRKQSSSWVHSESLCVQGHLHWVVREQTALVRSAALKRVVKACPTTGTDQSWQDGFGQYLLESPGGTCTARAEGDVGDVQVSTCIWVGINRAAW